MLNTPFSNALPRQINPRKFAQQGIAISGSVALDALARVRDLLIGDEGDIHADLVFGLDEQKLLTVSGQIDVQAQRICQRCMEPMPISLACPLKLAIVWDEEVAVNLPKVYDPWIVGEDPVDIYQIIEDELLLSLPIVSYHEEGCVPRDHFSSGEEVQELAAEQERTNNPFQVLAALKGELPASPDETNEGTDK